MLKGVPSKIQVRRAMQLWLPVEIHLTDVLHCVAQICTPAYI